MNIAPTMVVGAFILFIMFVLLMVLDSYHSHKDDIPVITGDSDTDELLDDERLAQIEGQAIDQLMNQMRGK